METTPAEIIATTAAHLIALDIDGTLVGGDDRVPAETVQALELVRASGHQVVPATGRSLVGLVSVARRLGLTQVWAVCSNGALTVRMDSTAPSGYEVIEARTFAPGPVVRQARVESSDLRVAVEEIGWGWRVSQEFAPGMLNGPQKRTSIEELLAGQATRVALHGHRIADQAGALRRFGATVTPAGDDWLDLTAPGTSKATALERIRRLLGIDAAHTVAVGDGVNDIAMLGWAVRGVAMGQAPDAVRKVADETTGPITDSGVIPVLLSLAPPRARRPDLSPLAAQLTAAAHAGVVRAPGSAVVRVWHGSGPGLAGCEIRSGRRALWVPVPAGYGATMRDVERAAREAGLTYPRGNEGRRRAHWRTAASGSSNARAEFELPVTWSD